MRAIIAALWLATCPFSVAVAQSMTPQKVEALPSTTPTAKEAYGPRPQNVGELRLPPG